MTKILSPQHRKLLGSAVTVLYLPLLVMMPFMLAATINESRQQRLSRSFHALPHPPGTALVLDIEEFGNVRGSSNQCNYVFAQVRSYSGSRKQVEVFYKQRRIKSPVDGSKLTVNLVFAEDIDQPQQGITFDLDDINKWGLLIAAKQPRRYVLWCEDGHEPGCDLRCH